MAEERNDAQEKTEEPTQRQLEKFREEGQVARSQEITATACFAAAMLAFSIMGPRLFEVSVHLVEGALARAFKGSGNSLVTEAVSLISVCTSALLPAIILIFVITALIGGIQTRFLFSWKQLAPKGERIDPIQGFKKAFSTQMLVSFVKNAIKAAVIGYILYRVLCNHILEIVQISSVPLMRVLGYVVELIVIVFAASTVFLLVMSAVDYLYNWWQMQKKMKMSRQELKDEIKQTQLPDNVRAKIRQTANERAKRTIDKEVPKADVIITNPTHVAVAIRYLRGTDAAPRVVAKGLDLFAQRIKSVAAEHKIVIYEEPPLARLIYRRVKVGHEIPRELFKAVARILAYVYSIRRRLPRQAETRGRR